MTITATVLLIDADDPLGQSLAERLRDSGHRVLTHARTTAANAPADLVGANVAAQLPFWDAAHGPFDRIVFGLRGGAERLDNPEDVVAVQEQLDLALGELKAAGQSLSRRDDSQIWVLLQEDSMGYYLPVSAQPMRSRALMGAVKSFAKELFRFGVKLNVLQVQPLAEQIEPATWKAARDGLKAYALKFKPQRGADVARMLAALIGLPAIPVAGMVLPVGIGYPEANV